MKIQECYVENFGGLSGYHFCPEEKGLAPGLNKRTAKKNIKFIEIVAVLYQHGIFVAIFAVIDPLGNVILIFCIAPATAVQVLNEYVILPICKRHICTIE